MFLFSDYWAGYCTTMVCNSSHNNYWFCATPQKSSNGRGDTTRFKWGNVSKVVQVDNWNRMMTGLFPHIGYHLNHTKIYWYVCVGFACQGFKILLTDTIYRAVYNIVLCYSGLSTFSLYLLVTSPSPKYSVSTVLINMVSLLLAFSCTLVTYLKRQPFFRSGQF